LERKKIVIVDAYVVVKWFVEEKYSRESRLQRDAYVNGLY
jgi:predicted nucleic acid-binding protein